MVISWAFSVQFWILFSGDTLTLAYIGVDIALALAFFSMSRGRWFPVPLFFLHAALVLFHTYTLIIDQSPFWMIAFLNRSFELALVYITACAMFRVRVRRTRETG